MSEKTGPSENVRKLIKSYEDTFYGGEIDFLEKAEKLIKKGGSLTEQERAQKIATQVEMIYQRYGGAISYDEIFEAINAGRKDFGKLDVVRAAQGIIFHKK